MHKKRERSLSFADSCEAEIFKQQAMDLLSIESKF
jgi:hypothetical protein